MKIGLQTLRKALVAAAAVASLGATAQTVRIANQGDALSMVSTKRAKSAEYCSGENFA